MCTTLCVAKKFINNNDKKCFFFISLITLHPRFQTRTQHFQATQ